METERRAKDGARWLDHCAHTWRAKGVFIRDHNWWHAALFRLALGDEEGALEIFDAHLWGAWPEFPQEQIGAVSLLWRLELRGLDVGGRWAPVAAQARRRAGEHYFPFHDIHYLYALARAGDAGEAESLLASMTRYAERLPREARHAWEAAALPCAAGALAFARGAFADAADALAEAAPALHLIGGSHAQRHLFHECREAAAMRAARATFGLARRG